MNIIIFGATSGIGKGLAKLFVDKGHKVAITGRRLDKLKEIQQTKPKNYVIKQHDVTEIASSETVFEELVATLSTIDIIVYSSGIGALNRELNWQKELPTLETNILGAAKILGLSYQFFQKQGYGHIVGISSISGIRGNAHAPAYAASKSFLSNYLESLWIKGKKVNQILSLQILFLDLWILIWHKVKLLDVLNSESGETNLYSHKKEKGEPTLPNDGELLLFY